MAWENINKIFPSGYVLTTQGDILTNRQIKEYKLKKVSSLRQFSSRGMFYKEQEWVWGSEGQFAIITHFDALNLVDHVDNVEPLNIYGYLMLKDYIDSNNIVIEKQNNININNQQVDF